MAGTVKLEPSDVYIDVGKWATFDCYVSCELIQSHTIKWFLGSSVNVQRRVDSEFEERTGIQVEIQDGSVCDATSGEEIMVQRLHVKISSAQKLNRSAVQCAALRKSPSFMDHYSHYSVIIVNGMFLMCSIKLLGYFVLNYQYKILIFLTLLIT